MPFYDVKKIYHSITKEAKYMFESNQHRPAFAKYKKVALYQTSRYMDESFQDSKVQGYPSLD